MKKLLIAFSLTLALAPSASQAGDAPALQGYCPVAYTLAGKAVKGDAKWVSQFEGKTYYFAAAGAKQAFDAAPQKFRIAYDGFCATSLALGKKVAGDPTIFSVHAGVTYLFSSADTKAAFDKDPAGTIAKAGAHWSDPAQAGK